MIPGKSSAIYYGWYIAFLAFVANFMSVGTSFYIFNAFMEPLNEAHGWSRTALNMALVLGMLAGFVGQFLAGTMVMRTGPRILMLIGPVLSGGTCILLGRTDVLWQFYALYVLLYLGSMIYGGVVASTAVNNWFVRKKGKALGFASAGISFSGAVLPLIAMALILHSTIADAFLWIGLLTMAVGPLSWLVVRDWPEQFGLHPDGLPLEGVNNPISFREQEQPGIGNTAREEPWTFRRLIVTGTFWKVGLSLGLALTSVGAVMSQLKPRFADLGFDDMTAMWLMALTACIGAVAKYLWGLWCDRFDPRHIFAVLVSMMALGLGLALIHDSLIALALFIVIFGFSMGGVMSLFPIIVADLYGRESFPAVFRYISLIVIIEVSGFVIAGQSFDRTGSYDLAYIIFIVLALIAVYLIATAKRPRIDEEMPWG
ncbi:MAG: MFS transporter [Deltaproteobacteria bacterium]|nr:MFS transporter [Deltaproteobacteria bacterium]